MIMMKRIGLLMVIVLMTVNTGAVAEKVSVSGKDVSGNPEEDPGGRTVAVSDLLFGDNTAVVIAGDVTRYLDNGTAKPGDDLNHLDSGLAMTEDIVSESAYLQALWSNPAGTDTLESDTNIVIAGDVHTFSGYREAAQPADTEVTGSQSDGNEQAGPKSENTLSDETGHSEDNSSDTDAEDPETRKAVSETAAENGDDSSVGTVMVGGNIVVNGNMAECGVATLKDEPDEITGDTITVSGQVQVERPVAQPVDSKSLPVSIVFPAGVSLDDEETEKLSLLSPEEQVAFVLTQSGYDKAAELLNLPFPEEPASWDTKGFTTDLSSAITDMELTVNGEKSWWKTVSVLKEGEQVTYAFRQGKDEKWQYAIQAGSMMVFGEEEKQAEANTSIGLIGVISTEEKHLSEAEIGTVTKSEPVEPEPAGRIMIEATVPADMQMDDGTISLEEMGNYGDLRKTFDIAFMGSVKAPKGLFDPNSYRKVDEPDMGFYPVQIEYEETAGQDLTDGGGTDLTASADRDYPDAYGSDTDQETDALSAPNPEQASYIPGQLISVENEPLSQHNDMSTDSVNHDTDETEESAAEDVPGTEQP